jgi:UTP-glucose-1-phosphate uridylyltransferase
MQTQNDGSLAENLMNLALLVLAAGMGSRYGGLKQLVSVGPCGETIIDYSVYDALRAGFNKLVFVIRHDIEAQFREIIGRRFENRIAVEYVFQELTGVPRGFHLPPARKKTWGTGHAVLVAAGAIREPFAVINGDDFYGAASFQNLAAHLRKEYPCHAMVGFVLQNTLSDFGSVSRGICDVTPDGFLKSVTELTRIEKAEDAARNTDATGRVQPLTGQEIVSMNMWGFAPSIFDPLREQFCGFLQECAADEKAEFYIPTVVNHLVGAGLERLKVLRTADTWFGVTYREDCDRAAKGIRQMIARGQYPEKL